MLPTLFGRIQTRLFLMAVIGGPVTALITLVLPLSGPWGPRFQATFVVLGSVFLALTGGEALYADMGHFGKLPIRLAWLALVLPSLVLNYFGQGGLLDQCPVAFSQCLVAFSQCLVALGRPLLKICALPLQRGTARGKLVPEVGNELPWIGCYVVGHHICVPPRAWTPPVRGSLV